MAEEKAPQNFNQKPMSGNKTPDPHPEHTDIPKKPAVDSLKEMAAKLTTDNSVGNQPNVPPPPPQNPVDPSGAALPGTEELKTFNAEQTQMPEPHVVHKAHIPKFNWKIALVAVITLFLLGVGGFTVVKGDIYWARDLVGLGLSSDPEKALEEAYANTNELKSAKGNMSMDFGVAFGEYTVDIGVNADLEMDGEKKAEKIVMSLDEFEYSDDLVQGYAEEYEDMIENIQDSLTNLEIRTFDDGKEGYINMPSAGETWLKLDSSALEDYSDLTDIVKMTSAGKTSPYTLFASASYANEVSTSQDFTKYIKGVEKVADESLDGERVYHYKGEFDFSAAGEDAEEIEDYLNTEVNFWITKKEMIVTKMDMKFSLGDLGEMAMLFGDASMSFDLALDISNYNEGVTIDKPTDYQELTEEMIEDLLAGQDLEIDATSSRNTQREADIAQIKTALEQYYADNNAYPVTNIKSTEDGFLEDLGDYLEDIPKDPSHPDYYYSYRSDDGEDYSLNYVFETSDSFKIQEDKSS